jgi:hypothetical protein
MGACLTEALAKAGFSSAWVDLAGHFVSRRFERDPSEFTGTQGAQEELAGTGGIDPAAEEATVPPTDRFKQEGRVGLTGSEGVAFVQRLGIALQ